MGRADEVIVETGRAAGSAAEKTDGSARSARTPIDARPDIFGELLPEQTRDDQATWDERRDEQDPDEHLRREVPPHY